MTILKHELRQGRLSFLIWTISIAFLLLICVFLFPEMKAQMAGVSSLFASMGIFTKAFGMDVLNFGELTGFYAIECGNIMGLGGAFFAAFCAVPMLSKEEKDHTAEFLLTHPVSRRRIAGEKLGAVLLQITLMNLLSFVIVILSILMIGETLPLKERSLLHVSYYLLQLELAGICFGISAFLHSSGFGIGLGIATIAYFLNLIANLSDRAAFLKYITPFGYADGASIISSGSLDPAMLIPGMLLGAAGILIGFCKYCRKDIV